MSIRLPLGFFSGAPGAGELVVVFVVILILFGPRRLPEVARTIGKILAHLRRASYEFRDQVMSIDTPRAYDVPPDPDAPDAAHCDRPDDGGDDDRGAGPGEKPETA